MGFGAQIRSARKSIGLSGEVVASAIGVTKVTISKWENDVHSPNVEQVRALCNVLKISPNFLFEWEKSDLPPDAMEEAKVYAALPLEEKRKWKALRRAMFATA